MISHIREAAEISSAQLHNPSNMIVSKEMEMVWDGRITPQDYLRRFPSAEAFVNGAAHYCMGEGMTSLLIATMDDPLFPVLRQSVPRFDREFSVSVRATKAEAKASRLLSRLPAGLALLYTVYMQKADGEATMIAMMSDGSITEPNWISEGLDKDVLDGFHVLMASKQIVLKETWVPSRTSLRKGFAGRLLPYTEVEVRFRELPLPLHEEDFQGVEDMRLPPNWLAAVERVVGPGTKHFPGGMTAHCSSCDAHETINYNGGRMAPEGIRNVLRNKNWVLGKRPRCPDCSNPKAKEAPMPQTSVKTSTLSVIPTPDARKARRETLQWLEEAFDTSLGRFKDGQSDQTIAKEVGLSEVAVAEIREEFFGPLAVMPPEVEALRAEIRAFYKEIEDNRKAFDAANRKAVTKVEHMERSLNKLVTEHGWKA